MTDDQTTTEKSVETPTIKKVAKKAPKKKAAKKAAPKKAAVKSNKAVRNYPQVTLEKCLVIAQKIKELNGGNPWTPKDISKAIGVGVGNTFYYYTASSRDFGFTTGSSTTSQIGLTEVGREIVYAPNPIIERAKKIEAFLKIELFKKVLDYYKGSTLPEMKYLSNTLENQFNLHPDLHQEFSQIFSENCKDLNIITGNPIDDIINNGESKKSPSTIIVGETKKGTKGKLKAFVIMPFIERGDKRPLGFFKEVLDSLLIPAGIDAEFTVETANKQGSDVIQSTIINDLLEADLVIADLTDHNPNVLFELGMRMAMDKPVALIKSKDTGRIFDVDNMLRVYEYNQNLWKSTIEKDVPALTEHFKAAWDNRDSEQTYMKILRKGVSH